MPRNSELIKRIESNILLADGAWGTELHAKGLRVGDCPELLNFHQPELVFEVAKSYVDAGSDIIETNSFGGSKIKLKDYSLESKCYELNKAAAKLSRKAAKNNIVLGSIGPTGKFLMTGEITAEELHDSFYEQCKGLIDGGVNALCFETFYDLEEAKVAIKAANKFQDVPKIFSFTFQKTADNIFNTIMGNSVHEVFSSLLELDVDVLGTNCGNGISDMVKLVSQIRGIDSAIPILIQSNAGLPEIVEGELKYNESPKYFKDHLNVLIEAGANIIGGCCGTTPEYISEMRLELDRIKTFKK